MKPNHTKVIALTGNIGTGKSTVAWIFGELGVPVIDADELAHEALAPHSPAWKQVYERYGSKVLGSDGAIDRGALAAIVFASSAERKFLEAVIHPHVKEQIGRETARLSKEGRPFAICEVPLLFEAGWQQDFAAVIVVRCDEEAEIERCRTKFGMQRDQVLARLAAQRPLAEKVAAADAVIDNNGPVEETRVQVQRLHQEMVTGRFPKT